MTNVNCDVSAEFYLKKRICIAMIAQLAPTYGLNLSPILLIFHKNPVTPDRFSR